MSRRRAGGTSNNVLALLLMLLALGGAMCSEALPADESASQPAAAGPLRWVRVLVPVERLGQPGYLDETVRYVPVDPAEFERLIQTAQKASQASNVAMAAAVVSARYTARLEGDALVDGEAWLDVVHSGEGPVMLPLEPCGLPVSDANWASEDGQIAKLGLGPEGKLGVLVERSGRLHFRWSLRGRREKSGEVGFAWEAPPAPSSCLLFDAPANLTPLVPQGLVAAEGPAQTDPRRWRIETGGHHRFELRFVPGGSSASNLPSTRVRQWTEYRFSLYGLDVSARLELDVDGEPLRQLTLALSPGLELTSAVYGESPLEWTVGEKKAGASAASSPGKDAAENASAPFSPTIVLEFSEPMRGNQRVVRLQAISRFPLARRWRLPTIQAEGVFWEGGGATLSVLEPLRLEELVPLGGQQSSRIEPLPAPGSGETIQLQHFAPDAAAEVVLTRPEAPLEIDSAQMIELSGREVTAQIGAELAVAHGKRFQLEADLSRSWVVDSVEATPSDALADWTVDREGGTARLVVRLARAIPERLPDSPPLRLRISARRLQSPLGRTLRMADLAPLEFRGAAGGRRLVCLRARQPYQLKLAGAESLVLLEPPRLEPAVLGLFSEPPRGLLFENDFRAAELKVSLEARRPSYTAAIRVEATISDDSLTESYRFDCTPQAGRRIDRVLVRFSQARAIPFRWTLDPENEQRFSARRLAATESTAGGAASAGETWEIRLNPPRSVPFLLRATRTQVLARARRAPSAGQIENAADGTTRVPPAPPPDSGSAEDPQPVGLAWLPEAAAQEGTVVVCSAGSASAGIENRLLKPISTEGIAVEPQQTVRAAFRYDPAEHAAPTSEPPLSVARLLGSDAPPSAWVWSYQLDSRYEQSGAARHVLSLRVETSGLRRLRVALPPGVGRDELRGVWVDGEQVACRWWEEGAVVFSASSSGGDGAENASVPFSPETENAPLCFFIDLPAGERFPLVSLHLTTPSRRLGTVAELVPPFPEIDVPVLSRKWSVWLPPGYTAWGPDLPQQPWQVPPMSWPQRLFGALGRPPDGALLDPVSPDDWGRLVEPDPERRHAEQKAAALVRQLGQRVPLSPMARGSGAADWGGLFADTFQRLLADSSSDGTGMALLVDWQAAARQGLTPQTPVRRPASHIGGGAVLREANLVLLVHPRAIVATTSAAAAIYHAQLAPPVSLPHTSPEAPILRWVRKGPLFEQIGRAAAGEPDSLLVPAALWRAEAGRTQMPWQSRKPSGLEPADPTGWTACQFEIAGSSPPRLWVLHRDTLDGLGWAVFLAVVALGWRGVASRRPATIIVALGVFSGAALLLPETLAPIASGAVLGVLFALAVALIRPRKEDAHRLASCGGGSAAGWPGNAAPRLALIFLVLSSPLLTASPGRGAEARARTAWWPVHGVLIPVDQNAQPTGDKYYVPEEFDRQLRRIAAAGTEQAQGWLVTGAVYRASLAWQPAPERLALADLRATFELDVLSPSARIRIPFGPQGPSVSPEGAVLDGHPVQHEVQQDALVFTVADKGRHRLELVLRPRMQPAGAISGFDVAIPRLVASRLELTIPADAPTIDVRSAVGVVRQYRQTSPARVEATLGPADQLAVRWPGGPGAAADGREPDVEELLWLKLKPGAVQLDARFVVDPVGGPVSELRLAADSRLKLRPLEGAEVQTTAGQPATVHLQLSEPIAARKAIQATFLMADASGVGSLRMPQVEVLGARRSKRWMAVSVDPSLEAEERAAASLERVGLPDFLAAWGDASVQPRSAYALAGEWAEGGPPWSITTRPVAPRTTASQTVAWSFGADTAQVQWDARLTTTPGYVIQHRLAAPPILEVDSVSLMEGEVERVDRWRHAPDGTISVFLKRAVTGEQALSLRGRMPLPTRGKLSLPLLSVLGADLKSSEIELFRAPDVRVEVTETAGLVEVGPAGSGETRGSPGRLAKRFQADVTGPVRATLILAPNRPVIHAQQVTSLALDGAQWRAKADFHLRIENGALDELRVSVPRSMSGPCEISPAVDWTEEAEQEADQEAEQQPDLSQPTANAKPEERHEPFRRIVVRPSAPVMGEYRLTVSSPLAVAAGEAVSVPHVVLEGIEPEEHLVVLPTRSRSRPLDWDTHGLTRTLLPEEFAAPPERAETLAAYRVEQPAFRATAQPFRLLPTLHLADFRVAWQPGGATCGVALFDIQSGGASHCLLRLPPGSELVQATRDGTPVAPVRQGDRLWQVPLLAGGLPQQVAVLFRGRAEPVPLQPSMPRASGWLQLEPPSLEGLRPAQTLWTVSCPRAYRLAGLGGGRSIWETEYDLLRLRHIEEMMAIAAAVTRQEPDQADRWYRAWGRRWAALCLKTQRRELAAYGPEALQSAADRLLPLDRLPEPVATRLRSGDLLGQAAADAAPTTDPSQLWFPTLGCTQPVMHAVAGEGSGAIAVQLVQAGAGSLLFRWAGAAAAMGLALAAVLALRWGIVGTAFCRWPCAVGVLVGLGWWLWLWPSALGWGIVLVSLIASFRWGFRRRRSPGSAIVPLTLGQQT